MWWLLPACADRASFEVEVAPDGLPRDEAPADARARYREANAWSLDHGGQDLVVVEGPEVVFEAGAPGYDRSLGHPLYSGTKTFACLLVQSAIAAGDVDSLDERVGDAWPAVLDPDDPRRERITVRHLLSFTSGLADDNARLTRDGLLAEQRVTDKAAVAAAQPLVHDPGTTFDYGSVHLWVLAGWYRARTGHDPLDDLEARVFAPLGFETAGWTRDPAGNPAFAYGAWTTAGQWAKIGVLLRDDGVWDGVPVLPPGAVAECATGSDANPAYGLTMWLNRETPARLDPVGHTLAKEGRILLPTGPDDLFAAAGALDQRLYVIPSRDLVVARLGDGDRGFRDEELLARLLWGLNPPGGCATAPGASGWLAVALLAVTARRGSRPSPPSPPRSAPAA